VAIGRFSFSSIWDISEDGKVGSRPRTEFIPIELESFIRGSKGIELYPSEIMR